MVENEVDVRLLRVLGEVLFLAPGQCLCGVGVVVFRTGLLRRLIVDGSRPVLVWFGACRRPVIPWLQVCGDGDLFSCPVHSAVDPSQTVDVGESPTIRRAPDDNRLASGADWRFHGGEVLFPHRFFPVVDRWRATSGGFAPT